MSHNDSTRSEVDNGIGSRSISRKSYKEEQPLMRSVNLTDIANGPFVKTSTLPRTKSNPLPHFAYDTLPNNSDVKLPRLGVNARSTSNPTSWNVLNSSLEALPDDFPLEKTSRHLPGADASIVAARVCECLRIKSIEAHFDNDKAKAKCKTSDFVFFRIRLFSGSNGGVTIEVQRRKGNSISFVQACRAVLDAAEGEGAFELDVTPFIKCPVSKMDCLKHNYKSPNGKRDAEIVINDSETLLLGNCHDAHVLALESLEIMTNPLQCFMDTCIRVSINVLSDSSVIRQAVASLIEYGSLRNEDESMDNKDVDGNVFFERLRTLALSVLSNALCVLLENATLTSIIQEQEDWFINSLLPTLIQDLKNAEYRPYDAFLAVKCLVSLVHSSSFVRQRSIEEGAFTALTKAVEFGTFLHLSLEKEAVAGLRALYCLN